MRGMSLRWAAIFTCQTGWDKIKMVQYPMLASMLENWQSHTLVVGMRIVQTFWKTIGCNVQKTQIGWSTFLYVTSFCGIPGFSVPLHPVGCFHHGALHMELEWPTWGSFLLPGTETGASIFSSAYYHTFLEHFSKGFLSKRACC
jgi:hypothetical protein